MQVVLYSIVPKDNLHHTSVFPLTISAGLVSLYHQQQWLSLMTRTMLVKAGAEVPTWLASEPTKDTRVYHLQQTWLGGPCELLELTIGNSLGFTIQIQDLSPILGAECTPVSKENLAMYFHGQDSLEWVYSLDQPWLN